MTADIVRRRLWWLTLAKVRVSNCVRVIVTALIQTLDSLDLKYPEVGPDKLKELAAARAALVK